VDDSFFTFVVRIQASNKFFFSECVPRAVNKSYRCKSRNFASLPSKVAMAIKNVGVNNM
jgi:hypothetical protein